MSSLKSLFVIFLIALSLPLSSQEVNYNNFVNPFIGTDRMGHTFPGAAVPFGMVQLSPSTSKIMMFDSLGNYNSDVYKYCAGYQYGDSIIYGFAHTHFSGTGHSDLGDILIMPYHTKSQDHPLFSHFSHDREHASPGYYSTFLDTYNIRAELTATQRCGIHKYTFDKDSSASLNLDLSYNIYNYDGKNIWSSVRVESDTLITGMRITSGWARHRVVYFAISFSSPIKSYGYTPSKKEMYKSFYRKFDQEKNFPEMAGRGLVAHFDFGNQSEELVVKCALSSVSTNGAVANLQKEAAPYSFDQIRKLAGDNWEEELSKIEVETINPKDKEIFYTAMYHTMLSPVIYEDCDGSYRGVDGNIYESLGFDNYTIFSLWDTYRALHPLFNIIQRDRNRNMILSMQKHSEQSVHKALPVWSNYSNENWCMIGYHAVSVIADALEKGIRLPAKELAISSKNSSSIPYYDGLDHYIKHGYVAEDLSPYSASKTLEYAYDDWAIHVIAEHSGDSIMAKEYLRRSNNYKNIFDSTSGFMRPKLSDGSFKSPFDPMDTHGQGFIEGNAWNYGLYVPHNPKDLISMYGGQQKFDKLLDTLFTKEIDDRYIEKNEDITRDGIIGNYVHGNEPGHHIAYLYNYTGGMDKCASIVRKIMREMYDNTPDGLCGNDDAGQMSAWYIFNALGFYPLLPGSDYYEVGSPIVKSALIRLGNGKELRIICRNQSDTNYKIKSIKLNGVPIVGSKLRHSEIMKGGVLEFEMYL